MAKKSTCWGIKSKNPGQAEAIKALLDPSIDLVVLEGMFGSGKTLLALAAGLEQVLETKSYKHILFTRAPVGVGEDIGFLPGTEEEKVAPWCGALYDNLEVLVGDEKLTETILKTKIKIRAMQFMRGRSFQNLYLIIDECQNLTIQQLKVIISRAGENTKVVCLGDRNQTDHKKLNGNTNGLSILCEQGGNEDFIKIVQLPEGVRSRLSSWSVCLGANNGNSNNIKGTMPGV